METTNFLIVPGRVYDIFYVDKGYPCDCECHKEGSNVLHVVACCHDNSYRGAATLYGVKNGVYIFLTSPTKFVSVSRLAILNHLEEEVPLKTTEYQRGYLDGILSCV